MKWNTVQQMSTLHYADTVSDVAQAYTASMELQAGLRPIKLCILCSYMLSNNPRLKRLRQHAQSPVSWFRNPYVQLILVCLYQLMIELLININAGFSMPLCCSH